jgi:ribonucleoside-diphosphate reductase alpha chain
MKVIKSSGIAQEFDQNKIMQVLNWALEGIEFTSDIDVYDLFDRIIPHLKDEMTTSEIQDAIVKVAADSITLEEQDYQYVASNLAQFGLRKAVFGQFDPPKFIDHVTSVTAHGLYDTEILLKYSPEEIEELEKAIDHSRDFTFTYAGTCQLMDKYLVKDRSTGKIYETPQFAFMLIGMCLHQDEDKSTRLQAVKEFYEAVSTRKISLPTPIMAGVRTPTRQFNTYDPI